MAEHLLILTTVGNEEDAAVLARSLVEERVAACVNILGPMRSFYRWKGNLEEESERLLLIKTRTDRFVALEAAMKKLHPYEVPELVAMPITAGSAAYLGWVDESVGQPGR